MDATKTGAHFIRKSCARCIRKEIKDVILHLFNWMARINSALDYHFSSSKVTKPPSYYLPSALKERLNPFLTVFTQINDAIPRVFVSLILFFSYDPSGSPTDPQDRPFPYPLHHRHPHIIRHHHPNREQHRISQYSQRESLHHFSIRQLMNPISNHPSHLLALH